MINKCLWCKSNSIELNESPISKYKEINFRFYYCHTCEIKFASPLDTKSIDYNQIQKRHAGYAFHIADNEWINAIIKNSNKSNGVFFATQYLMYNSVDYRYADLLRQGYVAYENNIKLKILEIGCNLGYVGAVLMKQGHEYLGIDIQEESIKKAVEYYGDNFKSISIESFSNDETNKNKFDIVCSFEVIEHVANPAGFLNTALECVKKGGKIIMSTPDGSNIPKKQWFYDYPPIHLTLFKRKTFNKLKKENLKVKFLNKNHMTGSPHRFINLINYLLLNKKNEIPELDPNHEKFFFKHHGKKNKVLHSSIVKRTALIIKLIYAQICSILNLSPPGGSIIIEIQK